MRPILLLWSNRTCGESMAKRVMDPQKRVAVIGTGLAGLTAGYLLAKQGCDVCLLEVSETLGFHSSSLEITAGQSRPSTSTITGKGEKAGLSQSRASWRLDVPMRSFQGGYYPQLLALYKHLNIPVVASDFTFSFSNLPAEEGEAINPHFIHSGASGLSIPSIPSSASKTILGTIQAVGQFILFAGCYIILLVLAFLSHHDLLFGYDKRPLGHVNLGSYVNTFIEVVVVPLFSAVGTMSRADVKATRISTILSYIHLTVGTSHYRVHDSVGARGVAEILTQPVQRVMLGVSVTAMEGRQDGIALKVKGQGDVVVDEVIIATPAGAARVLTDMYEAALLDLQGVAAELERVKLIQRGLLDVEYRETIVVTHRDRSVLPTAVRDVRDINLIQPGISQPASTTSSRSASPVLVTPMEPGFPGPAPYFNPSLQYTMATHTMNPPASFSSVGPVYQTTNPCMPIKGDVLAVARLERALPLSHPCKTLRLLHPPQSQPSRSPKLHIVGSYAYPGIPLLEGCVGSARKVANAIAFGEELVDWNAGEEGGFLGRAWRWKWQQ